MKKEPIKQIKDVQAKALNFILSTIIIACGVNFIATGIVGCIANDRNGIIYLVIGCCLIIFTIIVFLIVALLHSTSKTIIECAVTYDRKNKTLVEIPRYDFSEELKKYLDAACNESVDIKSIWNKDYLGFNGLTNKKEKTLVSLSHSAALLNQLIEYILLQELSLITVDYFNKSNFKKDKVNIISKIDVPDLFADNVFLSLFSKPTSDRIAFDNRETPNVVMAYSHNGALYEKFELSLPKQCKIYRKNSNIVELKHPLFKLQLTPAFTGFGIVLPRNFEKHYLHSSIHKVRSYKAMIGIELKLSWKSFFIRKSEYFGWIDEYIQHLIEHNSFKYFIDNIHWDIVETIIECSRKD